MIKSTWVGSLIFLIVFIFIIIKAFKATDETINDCEKEKAIRFNGVVKDIQRDSVNRPQRIIYLTNGLKIERIYTYGLWNEIRIGDSVVKEKGGLNYRIFDGPDFKFSRTLKWDKPCKGS
jgi:hypothetical protein